MHTDSKLTDNNSRRCVVDRHAVQTRHAMRTRRFRGYYILFFAIVALQSQVELYTVYAAFTGDDNDEKLTQLTPVLDSTVFDKEAKIKQKDVQIGNLTNSSRIEPNLVHVKLAQDRDKETTARRGSSTATYNASGSTEFEPDVEMQRGDTKSTHTLLKDKHNSKQRSETLQASENGLDVQTSLSSSEDGSHVADQQTDTNLNAKDETVAPITTSQCAYCEKVWGCLGDLESSAAPGPLVYQVNISSANVDRDRPSNNTVGIKNSLHSVSTNLWSYKDFDGKKLKNCTDVLADMNKAKRCSDNRQNDHKFCETLQQEKPHNAKKVNETEEGGKKAQDAKPKDKPDTKTVPHIIIPTQMHPPAPLPSPPPAPLTSPPPAPLTSPPLFNAQDYVPAVTVAVTEVAPMPSTLDDVETQEAQARQARTISGKSDAPFLAFATAIVASGVVSIILVVVYVNHRQYDGRETPSAAAQNVSARSGTSESEASVYNDPLETRFSSIVMITPNGNGICVL